MNESLQGGSLRKTAANFVINYKTLQRYAKLHQKDGHIENARFGYITQNKCIFSEEQDQVLLEYILEASSIHYGLTLRELHYLAYEVVVANNSHMPKNHGCLQKLPEKIGSLPSGNVMRGETFTSES
ncbi:unnamed protein product [Lepeophtheirus salmonis]|uniref:(salmon louse) hypothetical protein n=1 Tax=Lepeophtheirus salmonis TaxID=72036 RepID=A0A7R8CN23_LEPSM|nr:unnamed protein product [Lepeophtheirus salmonis]CAF2870859.1 unnamed protein product [Lepeophtheirus salmonis]